MSLTAEQGWWSKVWSSPINAIYHEVEQSFEDAVFKAIQKVEIEVDREELIKALQYDRNQYEKGYADGLKDAKKTGKWIPVTERLPEEPFGCLVTVWDTDPISMDEFENLLPYFVGWDGEQWNDGEGLQCPFEVIAWMPLPEPYKEVE